jgi:arylsulfatase A-like enzyme
VEGRDSPPQDAVAREIWRHSFSPLRHEHLDLPVEAGTLYQLRRSGADCGRLGAVEQARFGKSLRRHGVEGDRFVLRTTPTTQRLRLDHWPVEGAACADRAAAAALDRYSLSGPEELALLKAEALAEGADPALGIAKHGQFLPLPDVDAAHPPFDHNFDFRDALFAPAPSDLTFPLRVPAGARLRFSYALSSRSLPGDSASFRVTVRAGTEAEQEMFRDELSIDPAGRTWHWHDASVDLERFAGRAVRLSLSTRAPPGSRGYAVWGQPIVDAPRAPGDPPNVILIAVDTLRADRLSCYGYPETTTPRLDALAADGIRFAQAISSATWTRPAFASLFTGLTPARHGVRQRFAPLAPERRTLAEIFRAAGWVTHAILYKPFLYDDGHHQGFDTYFNVPQTAKFAEQNLRKALIWLQRNGDRRFFLFVHFDDPHQPLTQPVDFVDETDRAEMEALGLSLPMMVHDDGAELRDPETGEQRSCEPCAAERPRFRRLARNLYDDEVAFVDDRIGALIDYLMEQDLYDSSVVAFVSDHGESLWDHDEVFGHDKVSTYDALVHVPLILKPPAASGLPRGRVVGRQVRAFDLMPTLLELAGLDPAAEAIEARSLVPLLAQGDAAEPDERVAWSESHGALGIRQGGFKYIAEGDPPRERLFDLGRDPEERQDVAASHPAVLERMRRLAAAYRQGALADADEPASLDAQKVEALRALGYLE